MLRALTLSEKSLLDRLLAADIPGQHELRVQLQHAKVEPIDENGSLQFVIDSVANAPVARRVPVEAQCLDSDGTCIHALLHVVGGVLAELEFYKDDSSLVIRMPLKDEWGILVLD